MLRVRLVPVFGLVGYVIGTHKNRLLEGFLWGFLLGPFGILIIALSQVHYARKCPECRLGIPRKAKRCGHCGAILCPDQPEALSSAHGLDPHSTMLPARQGVKNILRFSCPACSAVLAVPESAAGKKGPCPKLDLCQFGSAESSTFLYDFRRLSIWQGTFGKSREKEGLSEIETPYLSRLSTLATLRKRAQVELSAANDFKFPCHDGPLSSANSCLTRLLRLHRNRTPTLYCRQQIKPT